jgi:pimeloyl-ACP methyl ester carboxylesterase
MQFNYAFRRVAGVLEQVCFPGVGCFDRLAIRNRITQQLHLLEPQSPSAMNLSFVLMTHEQPEAEQRIPLNFTADQLYQAGFRSDRRTVILVHGWLNSYASSRWWISGALNATLAHAPTRFQILAIDWGLGASHALFAASVANSHVVGATLAALVQRLVDDFDVQADQVHVIGFSLGAHIAGFAGKRLTGKYRLGAITGLDPAGPLFAGSSPSNRLDRFDATFVKVLHTYSGGFWSGTSGCTLT